MNYKSFNLGDWIGHISGVIEDETTLDGNEMRDLVEFLSTQRRESCDDAVSRKAVLNQIFYSTDNSGDVVLGSNLRKRIEKLPSVTPTECIATVKFSKEDMQELVNEKMKEIVVERKKGKWINKSHTSDCGIKFVASECSCCGKKTFFDCDQLVYNYCPNCGAEMEIEE